MRAISSILPKPVLARALRLSLAWQFVTAGVVVLLIGMILIGLWVTANVENAILQNRADATALFVDGIVSPLSQDLSSGQSLEDTSRQALAEAIKGGPLSRRIFSFKVWATDGTVAFSSDPELIGKRFDIQPSLRAALSGNVTAEFDALDGDEHAAERESGYGFLEIHSPIRGSQTGEVIGAAEFYEKSTDIVSELARARARSWLVVAGVTIGMLATLFVIVARGSTQIERQKRKLDDQVQTLSELLSTNTVLRNRVEEAAQRTVAMNERYLRRISADLHDGPTQLLGFAILRLEAIRKGKGREDDEALVRRSITEAIDEIRSICRDLRLPELERLTGREVAIRAIQAHEFHAGIKVRSDIADIAVTSHGARICIYRFLQETLSNATRHAKAMHISASVCQSEAGVIVRVEDDGVGFVAPAQTEGLGLAGLKERIASLGGHMEISTNAGGGAVVQMVLP